MADDATVVDAPSDGSADAGFDGEGAEGTSESDSLEQAAADFEAEAAGILDDRAATGDGKGDGKGDSTPRTGRSAIDRFIEKNYGGDEDAFMASLYNSREEQKRLASEIKELRQNKTAPPPRDVEAELKAHFDRSPEVLAVNQDLQGIEQENTAINQKQMKIVERASRINEELAGLTAKLRSAEDPAERYTLSAQLSELKSEMAVLDARFESNDNTRRNNTKTAKILAQQRANLQREIRSQLAQEEERQEALVQEGERVRDAYGTSFESHAEALGIDPATEEGAFAREAVKALLAEFMDSRGDKPGLDPAQVHDVTGRLLQKYAKAARVGRRTALRQTTPRQTVFRPAPGVRGSDRPAQRSSTVDVLSDPDMVRKRADAIFNAVGRRQNRGR